jgi:hypothetical protein
MAVESSSKTALPVPTSHFRSQDDGVRLVFGSYRNRKFAGVPLRDFANLMDRYGQEGCLGRMGPFQKCHKNGNQNDVAM